MMVVLFDKLKKYLEDLDYNSRPSLMTKALSEFVGCMIFHFIGSVAPSVVANSISLIVLVYYTARMSGAHLNPALTMTFALLGYTKPIEVLMYWIAQFTGSIVGASIVMALIPSNEPEYWGCFQANELISRPMILGWEAMGTFCFIMPIFSVVWYTQHKSGYGNTGPIIVGCSLFAAASAVSPWTGAALNPARALASAVIFDCKAKYNLPYYIAGEFIGALAVPLAVMPLYGMSSTSIMSHSLDDERISDGMMNFKKVDTSETSDSDQIIQIVQHTDSMSDQHKRNTPFNKLITHIISPKCDNIYECTSQPFNIRQSIDDKSLQLRNMRQVIPDSPSGQFLNMRTPAMSPHGELMTRHNREFMNDNNEISPKDDEVQKAFASTE